MTVENGVTNIPPSAFYVPENKHLAANLARYAFCKTEAVLIIIIIIIFIFFYFLFFFYQHYSYVFYNMYLFIYSTRP